MINNHTGQHPALDTITRITTDIVLRRAGWLPKVRHRWRRGPNPGAAA